MTATAVARPAVVVNAEQVVVRTRRGQTLLDDVSLTVRTGEVIAIVGPSGAGKTTLLQTLAELRRPAFGWVELRDPSRSVGYVPQDDIVHGELTVEETVRFAGRLRCGRGLERAALDDAVTATISGLDLSDRADVVVSSLSGGQRKRVSIATELVARPAALFLDEPTSGLDPRAASDLMDTLVDLAAEGTAVVFTTHHHADLHAANRLVVVAPGGRVDFDGPPWEAPGGHRVERDPARPALAGVSAGGAIADRTPVSRHSQIATLTRRNLVVLGRNRMSAAIMAGSPVAVVAMLAVLFRRGAGGPAATDASVAQALAYWLAFAGFFFGLTFGLLQVCTELAVVRRELHAAVDLDAYLVSKFAVLVPVLVAVDATMVGVLVAIGRIGGSPTGDLVGLGAVLTLDSVAGLAIGLLASAAVTNTSQATLALPMLCFPAVLFGGAIVPVDSMTPVGRALAGATSTRWAFDAVATLVGEPAGGLVRPSVTMALIAVLAAVGSLLVLARRVRPTA